MAPPRVRAAFPLLLVGLAVVLQGCGSGTKSCTNPQFNLVSQSLEVTLTGSVDMTGSLTTPIPLPPVSAQVTEKVDFDKMNFRGDAKQTLKVTLNGTTLDANVEGRVIFNAQKKQVVVWHKVTDTSGKIMEHNCTSEIFEELPSPEVLSMMFKSTILAQMQQKMSCSGNDGTYDTFSMDVSLADFMHPPMPPIPDGDSASAQVTMQMDKDFLIHSEHVTAKMHAKNGTLEESVQVEENMVSSSASLGGPSDADLDFSEWGPCYPAPGSVGAAGLNGLLRPGQSLGPLPGLEDLRSVGPLQRQILSAIQASLKPKATATAVNI